MARQVTFTEAEVQRATELRDKASTVADFRKALAVILSAILGIDADKVAEILGTSRRTVFRNRGEIRDQDVTEKKPWGGRRRCSMTLDEEREFLAPWVEQAASGGILTVPPIHAALVARLGHDVPFSTTYRLLARHGWRKVQPDTRHPKSDSAVQEDYKKNSQKRWMPPA